MVPARYESLLYFRRFPANYGRCAVYYLFEDGNPKSGFFPQEATHIEWEILCEFASVAYSEPLECVHARRRAFGCSEVRIFEDMTTPDRSLLFSSPDNGMESYGHVSIRWKPTGVMEVPMFCIRSATSDKCSVELGLELHDLQMLRAALTLEPARYDVFGFCTSDRAVCGAAEFTGNRRDKSFDVHVFVVAEARKLSVGDELWGWYAGDIGEARVHAKRLLAVVEKIPGLAVPRLERPDFR
jgi:hypothetical protein